MSRRSSKNDTTDEPPSAKKVRLTTKTSRPRPSTSNSSLRDKTEGSSEEEENLSQVADFHTPHEAEYGIIEHVSVKNFMCHKRLEFNFGPNVNFIAGRNGSGKSAVLTAIVVGLGGKAATTNRGSSIKSFIKNTEQFAEVKIKLRNRGQDAYKHDRYGDTIVIERRLKMDGTSSYKIKSKDGQTISQKYSDLQQIKDQFNIQIDNPMSILNQDTSRNFLHSQEAKDKYTFFLKATQLEQMSNDYASIQQHRDLMKSTLDRKQENLPDLEREVLRNEQRFKDLDSIQKLQAKKDKLMHMAAWAQVADKEKEVDAMKKEMKQEENRTPKFDEKIETSQANVTKSETHYHGLQDQLTELGVKIKDLQPEHALAKSEMDKKRKEERNIMKKVRNEQDQVRGLSEDESDLQQRIDELKNSARRDYEDERLKRTSEIQKLQEHIRAKEALKMTTEQDLEQFTSAISRAKEQIYGLGTRNSDIKHNIDSKTRHIQNLEASKNNRLKLYGDFMPSLLSEINKAVQRNMFHRKPKGPIGNYLKLRDQRWAVGIEACLKGLMYKFCCHDYNDMKVLNQLISRHVHDKKMRPGIIVSPFEDQRYDISQGAVRCQDFPSLLDMLDIDDPMIFNSLVDQRGVENVLLIESSQDARTVLRLHTPHNCREAFTLTGDQVYAGRDQRYYSNRNNKARLLQSDVADDIRELQQDLQQLRQQQQESQRQHLEVKSSINENEQQKRRAQTQRTNIQQAISQLVFDKEQLEAVEDVAPVDVSTLEEEIDTIAREKAAHQELQSQVEGEYKQVHKEAEAKKKEFMEMDKQMTDYADSVEPIKDDVLTASTEMESAKNHLRHYMNKKKEHLNKIAGQRTRFEEAQEVVQSMISKAEQVHAERIVTNRKPQNIDSEIDQITKRIHKEQESKGDPEQIIRRYDETKKSFTKIKNELSMFKKFIKKFDEILDTRKSTFLIVRRYIAIRAKMYFIMTLSKRGYNGKLTFNHDLGQLHITVQPTQGDGVGSQDMKSLSGGERSFSTVCFIMALWESMETPFRALDEFDVFMDMVNRRISMDLMLMVAKEQRMRQFIFLTPLDMSQISGNPMVRKFQMPDPIRNQGVLDFEPINRHNEENESVEENE